MKKRKEKLVQINASISKSELKSLDKNASNIVSPRSSYVRKLIIEDIDKKKKIKKD